MNASVHCLRFRYVKADTADKQEINRMMEDCPFRAEKIEVNGPKAKVYLETAIPLEDLELGKFINRMKEFGYKLGFRK